MVWSDDDNRALNQGGGSGQEQELDEGGESEEEESLNVGWRGEGGRDMICMIYDILYTILFFAYVLNKFLA